MKRKLLSILLTFCMAATMLSTIALAQEATFTDTSGHWAESAIEGWSAKGVLKGSDGAFRPNAPITRAELAAVLTRVIGYTAVTNTAFIDVPADAWYYNDMAKLYAAGIMLGDGAGVMRPTANITREEAVVLIARAFNVEENAGNENPFPDAGDISGWASFLVDGMKTEGYISGDTSGNFNPKASITRAEVVTILDNMITLYFNTTGERDCELIGEIDANALINTAGAVIKNLTINGNLWITEGVNDGDVTLENAAVNGTTYIRGGGPNSINIIGGSFGDIVLCSETNPNLKLSKNTEVEHVYLNSTSTVTRDGVTVSYDVATGTVIFSGVIDKSQLNADGTAAMTVGGITYNVIPPEGTISSVTLAANTVVKELVLDTAVTIDGTGTIEKATVSADGVIIDKSVDANPKNIFAADDISISVADKQYTGKDDYLAKETATGSGGSGGNGSTPSTPATDSLVFKWQADGTAGGNQSIAAAPGALAVGPIDVGTESVVITLSNTAAQSLTKSGAEDDKVSISGNDGDAERVLTVDTSAIKHKGGSITFTLTVSESGKTSINYSFEITIPDDVYLAAKAEAANLLDIMWADICNIDDLLGISFSEPLKEGYTYEIIIADNEYMTVDANIQCLVLNKLNLTDSAMNFTATVTLTHTATQVTVSKDIVVTLPVSKYWIDLKAEAAKIQDVSYTENSELGDLLGMSLSEPLAVGYTYALEVEENDYFETTADKQSFKLSKLNLINGVITGNFAIVVTDTMRDISIEQDIVVTLPTSKYLTALEAELAKFSNVRFAESAKENDELEMSLSEPLSADYTYEIIVPDNEYIKADGSKQKIVLKQTNETGNAIIQTITLKVKDTVRDISIEKAIRVTIPNYVYYGAKVGTLQLVGYHEEDISYNADLTTFWATYEIDDVIDTTTLSAADFIVKGMDNNASVSISNFKINNSQVVTMNVEIIAPDGDKKNYTISVHFANNPEN